MKFYKLKITKSKKIFYRSLILAIISLFSLTILSPTYTLALSQEQRKIFNKGIYYYNFDACGLIEKTVEDNTGGKINLDKVAQKYNLQSAVAMEVGKGVVGDYQSDTPPVSPASTMKLVIAATLIEEGVDLSKSVNIGSDVLYSGPGDDTWLAGKSSTTLQNALQGMLEVSSNVAANVLMKELGGVSTFTQKAKAAGYKTTQVGTFYNASAPAVNKSSIGDQAKAMDYIIKSKDAGNSVAKKALEKAAEGNNIYGVPSYMNKWAGNSKVVGNVGAFEVKDKKYIIGLYRETSYPSDEGKQAIKNGTDDIIGLLKNVSSGSGGSSSSDSGGSSSSKLDGYDLPATKGGTGLEGAISSAGILEGKTEPVTFQNHASLGKEYRDYYITMRWNYAKWNWNGGATDIDNEQMGWFREKPRLVLVTNPKTKKSIVAAALESGPAPWTGVDRNNNNDPKQGWTNPQKGTPEQYKGRVSGLPPEAFSALGMNSSDQRIDGNGPDLLYAWAPDQSAKPGPTDASADLVDDSSGVTDCSCGEGDGGGGPGTVQLTGSDNQTKIWNYLVGEMGLSNKQAAGIMGNIWQESKYDPTALNPSSGAYGIIQWYQGRLDALKDFASSKGKQASDIGVQLEFMKKELEGSYKANVLDPIKASDSIEEVTRIWLEKFEIPCMPGSSQCAHEMTIRLPQSNANLRKYSGSDSAAGSDSSSSEDPSTPTCGDPTKSSGTGNSTGEFDWPIEKTVGPVTSCYGSARGRLHTGLDIGSAPGTKVMAMDGGEVIQAGDINPDGFGNTVTIKHKNGKYTMYAHLSKISVREGDKVDKGQEIGKSGGIPGAPGAGSTTGPHLHFNVQKEPGLGQGSIDPLTVLKKDGRSISGGDCP